MVILTIKFPRSPKTYDYLMDNPEKLKIDRDKPLKMIIGSTVGTVISQQIELVNARKEEKLPSNVTSQLTLFTDNYVRSYPMSAKMLAALKTPKPTETKPSTDTRKRAEVLKDFLKWTFEQL